MLLDQAGPQVHAQQHIEILVDAVPHDNAFTMRHLSSIDDETSRVP